MTATGSDGPRCPSAPTGSADAVADGGDGGGADGAAGSRPSIERLAAEARRARESAEPPSSPPDEEAALAAARDGLGPVVARYIAARTGELERLSERQHELLHRAVNDWLAVYALAHGVEGDPDATVRTAAELVVDTHDIEATARLLVGLADE